MPQGQSPQPGSKVQLDPIASGKRLHQWKRLAGLLGCVLGACLMLWGRFSPHEAPDWAVALGFGVVVFSWLLLAYVLVSRWRWAKANADSR
ncbi:MAG: hypothetical protein SGJ21_09960 [Alphaproteobacteria bacterium]|nr:hypothetical protein [Alphaproteobacteria bacterium]